MTTTLNRVHGTRNADRLRKSDSGPDEQCRDTLNGTPLNDGVRASYGIEAESALLTLFLAGVSVGCVIAVGVMKFLGAR